MKKIMSLLAMLSMNAILITGCVSKPDEVAQKMIDDINAIGTVEVTDEDAIEKAEKLYSTLTDKQKDQVNNYADLLKARETIDILLEEKAKQEAEQAKKEAEEKEKLYTSEIKLCARSILSIKEMINDPNSLEVHAAISLESDQGDPSIIIDASCSSTSGGKNRHYFLTTHDLDYIKELVKAGAYYSYNYNIACGTADSLFDALSFNLLAKYDGIDLDLVNSLIEDYEETKDKTKLGLLN